VSGDQQRYLCYLLRVWTVDRNGSCIWRASLESSTTGERLGFRDLPTLFAYITGVTSGGLDNGGSDTTSSRMESQDWGDKEII
jgi:hypothetical protein